MVWSLLGLDYIVTVRNSALNCNLNHSICLISCEEPFRAFRQQLFPFPWHGFSIRPSGCGIVHPNGGVWAPLVLGNDGKRRLAELMAFRRKSWSSFWRNEFDYVLGGISSNFIGFWISSYYVTMFGQICVIVDSPLNLVWMCSFQSWI